LCLGKKIILISKEIFSLVWVAIIGEGLEVALVKTRGFSLSNTVFQMKVPVPVDGDGSIKHMNEMVLDDVDDDDNNKWLAKIISNPLGFFSPVYPSFVVFLPLPSR